LCCPWKKPRRWNATAWLDFGLIRGWSDDKYQL